MPNNTRGEFKRSMTYATGNIENAQEKLVKYVDIYGERYPEIAYALSVILTALDEIKELVNKLNESV